MDALRQIYKAKMNIKNQVILIRRWGMWITLLIICACTQSVREKTPHKIFRYNQPGILASLDPSFASDQAVIWATAQLYNGLVTFDENLKIEPELAESWKISEDGKVYTFKLRDDVHFHPHRLFEGEKGRKLDAYDVEYSLRRIIDTTDVYSRGVWIFRDKVLKTPEGTLSDTCFKAVNDSVFRIYLDRSAPDLLQVLAMPYAYIIPRDVAAHYGKDFRDHPVGTGPFKFQQWEESNKLIYIKNNDYWKHDEEGNQLPYIDAVEVSFTSDKSQAFRAFMLGNIDFISGVEESFIDEVFYRDGSVKESFSEKYTVEKAPYLNTEYIGFQLDPSAPVYEDKNTHPVLNKDFRKALSYCVDKQDIIINVRNGLGLPGINGMVPPAVPGYDSEKIKGYDYKVDKAQRHLQRSGIKPEEVENVRLTLSKEKEPLGQYLVKKWYDMLGVRISLDINEAKVNRDLAQNGKLAMFMGSWLGDYPDAGNYLTLFYSDNFSPAGPNKTRFSDEKYDELYQKALQQHNDSIRNEFYYEMDQLVMDEAPLIVLFYDEVIRLTQNRISNLQPNAMNLLDLERVKIESKK